MLRFHIKPAGFLNCSFKNWWSANLFAAECFILTRVFKKEKKTIAEDEIQFLRGSPRFSWCWTFTPPLPVVQYSTVICSHEWQHTNLTVEKRFVNETAGGSCLVFFLLKMLIWRFTVKSLSLSSLSFFFLLLFSGTKQGLVN